MTKKLQKYTATVLVGLLTLVGWKLICVMFKIPSFILPPPEAVIENLVVNTAEGIFIKHFWVTSWQIFLGFIIGSVLGIVLGYILSLFRVVEEILYPYIIALQVIPKIAVAPLLVLWFGFGGTPKIIGAIILVFFPVFVNTLVGVKSVDKNARELFTSLNASRMQIFWKLEILSSLPMIFASFKVAITLAIIGVVTVEFVGANEGLGFLVINASYEGNAELLFSTLVILMLMGLVYYFMVVFLERIFLRWHASERQGGSY